jgi:hypothetical protein
MLTLTAMWISVALVQTPPVPKPFPQPGQVTAPGTPAAPATSQPAAQTPAPAPSGTPTEASLRAPLYPTAEFLESFDAGKGQRYYLFGTNAAYAEIVGYYATVMKNKGRQIFEAPAMQQFELGKFVEQTMAYPPSVVVKDYTWNGSAGYLFVDGSKEKRFKTVIQIVPPGDPIR